MYGTICANSVSTSITNSAKHALRPVISGAFHMFGTMKAEDGAGDCLLQELVGRDVLGHRRGVNHLIVRVGVGVLFGEEVKVLLRAGCVVGAERERAVLDLGRIAPILVVHDSLHTLLDEVELQIPEPP